MPRKSASSAAASQRRLAKPDDDLPEITDAMLARAELRIGGKLVRRGRPPSAAPKQAIKLRLDPDVLAHFRNLGPGWQTRINATLCRAAGLRASDPPISVKQGERNMKTRLQMRDGRWLDLADEIHRFELLTRRMTKAARKAGDNATEAMWYSLNQAFRDAASAALEDRRRATGNLLPIEP
jgi:uncharacterized protein (DUF4415 family)